MTLTNMDAGTDLVAGRFGWAIDFDGADDRTVTTSVVPITTGAITVSGCLHMNQTD